MSGSLTVRHAHLGLRALDIDGRTDEGACFAFCLVACNSVVELLCVVPNISYVCACVPFAFHLVQLCASMFSPRLAQTEH